MFSSGIEVGMLVRVKGQGLRIYFVHHSSWKDGELIVRHKDGSMLSVKPANLKAVRKVGA